MANYFRLNSTNVPLGEVKLMILRNIGRLKSAGAILDHEAIGVELDESSLRNFLDTHNATKLIAFFGVDNFQSQHYSTIVLTGIDSNGNFIKDSNGDILATERWQRYVPGEARSAKVVDNDITALDRLLV